MKKVQVVATVDQSQRTRIISTLEWYDYGTSGQVLKGELDDVTYLVFGVCKLVKEKYRVEFTSKPDNIDMYLFSPANNKEAMKRAFVNLVSVGAITGIVEAKRING